MNNNPVISVIIPCNNEENNLRPLVAAIQRTVEPLDPAHEIIITDDASQDKSWEIIKQLAGSDSRIRGQRLARNCGQSAAIWAGVKAARGRYLVTMDADLQNDPADLPKFIEALKRFDCVCGTRVKSRALGDNFIKRASSRIANRVRNIVSGETISDAACCFRAFRRECAGDLKFFKGMHRFLPTLFKIEGYSVTEIDITHHARVSGRTHYGVWNRLLPSLCDLMAVCWMKKRMGPLPDCRTGEPQMR
jgi:glycosyltransferase involved in cell wall biosynthesis